MYEGQTIEVRSLDGGIAELCFDRKGEAINNLGGLLLDTYYSKPLATYSAGQFLAAQGIASEEEETSKQFMQKLLTRAYAGKVPRPGGLTVAQQVADGFAAGR